MRKAAPSWAFGRRPVAELLRAGLARRVLLASGARGLAELVHEAASRSVPVEWVPRDQLDRLAGGAVHQGVAAEMAPPAFWELEDVLAEARARGEVPLVVVAAHIQDPQNLGAIARTAEAAGAHGLLIPERRASPVTAAAMRAASGALAYLPVVRVTNLARAIRSLQAGGLWVVGADPEGEALYTEVDLTGPVALVIGSEGPGLPRLVRALCDHLVRLPMHGRVASLNASVAAGILLYEVLRQRRVDGPKRPRV